ncbi:MAG: zinc ribbon domain-containing protein [Thermoprotei archaeon]
MGKRFFTGRSIDLAKLAAAVEGYLSSNGYTTQKYQSSDQSYIVQAKKGGFLRAIISAQRAFTVHISGSPENVVVNVGVANWGQDIAVDVVESVLISEDLGLLSTAETLWNLKIERDILNEIERVIRSGQVDYTPTLGGQTTPQLQPQQQSAYQTMYQGYQHPPQTQPQRFCTMCGQANPIGARYCMGCGAPLPK